MYKVFISVPMNGRTDKQILDDMSKAKERWLETHSDICRNQVVEFEHNFKAHLPYPQRYDIVRTEPLLYLGLAIQKMACCDDVIFAEGWEDARGCVIERIAYELYIHKGTNEIEEVMEAIRNATSVKNKHHNEERPFRKEGIE